MFFYYVVFLLTFFSCSDTLISKVEDPQPQIVVHPPQIDFGHLISGQENGEKYFTIINAGNNALNILDLEFDDASSRFTIVIPDIEYLEPGELVDVFVYYNPTTYETNNATANVLSNDLEQPHVTVDIIGHGDAPVITLDPEGHDFGTISMGCDNELRLTVGNEGNLPLVINDVQQMVTQPVDIIMEFGSLTTFPWTIDPGAELDIITRYTPTDVGTDSSIISIKSNDPATPISDFKEDGVGQVEQWVNDQFEQTAIQLLDVLWVIDNSGSMHAIQQALASNMSTFMQSFLIASPDFHMAFITTDSHAFQGNGMLTSLTADPEVSAAAILNNIGTSGSGVEQGIRFSRKATSSTGEAAPGSQFFREDANLVIIYVSDEPDYSTPGWASYTSHFSTLKDVDKLHMIAITGDDPLGCTFSFGQYNRPIYYGEGYVELVNFFGGDVYSICAPDWGMQMKDLAENVATRRIFNLSENDPIVDTITVYVNGQEADISQWNYNEDENHIEFTQGSEPEEGHTIDINYATWGCD